MERVLFCKGVIITPFDICKYIVINFEIMERVLFCKGVIITPFLE